VEKSGAYRDAGRKNPMAKEFAESFSSHYGEIAEAEPVFAENI